jgi:hypothetical protein
MVQNNDYKNQSGGLEAKVSIYLELYVYELKPEYKKDFVSFYDTEIKAWLTQNSVSQAYAWIVDDYLVVLSTSPMNRWSGSGGIPGLGKYLKHTAPKPLKELKSFTLSLQTAVGEYAK